ncbi:INO80 complex subunit B, partial [Coemansia nantahalensis]
EDDVEEDDEEDEDEDETDGGGLLGSDDEDNVNGYAATAAASLTRRQRAKLARERGEELMELPVEAKRSRFSAEEAALRKSEHARRRKFQSQQRAEQLKNDTINRLLNKQTSKGRNKVAEDSETRSTSAETSETAPDAIRYIQRRPPRDVDTNDGAPVRIEHALLLPRDTAVRDLIPGATGSGFTPTYPKPVPTCAVDGCAEKKKYSVASLAACSLEHWRVLKDGGEAA